MKSVSKKTEKEIDDLLGRIKEKTGFTQEQIASKIGYNRSYISQAKKTDSEKLYMALYNGFKGELENLTSGESVVNEDSTDYSQPIIQVVLNLSYIGKKNAETMDKAVDGINTIAATNQKNTEIIAALVGAIIPNSKLASQLSSTLADLYKDGDRPVEDFLPAGTDLSKKQKVKVVKQA
jgi:transcriptional regulator with XRE-family HTH domain